MTLQLDPLARLALWYVSLVLRYRFIALSSCRNSTLNLYLLCLVQERPCLVLLILFTRLLLSSRPGLFMVKRFETR